ncbi:MAG: phosphate uptake regulator PhoU, partial [Thermoprotei archaeon]
MVVSLPAAWVKAVGLKPRQEVQMSIQPDLSLTVTAFPGSGQPVQGLIRVVRGVASVECVRTFIAHYIAGYDIIKISGLKFLSGSDVAMIKANIRSKLMGVEIVEETADVLVAQCLQGGSDLPLFKAIRRMASLSANMVSDAVDALLGADTGLAETVIERDDEVDRFAHFISRQLRMAVQTPGAVYRLGLLSTQDCLNLNLLSKYIERIADHSVKIAEAVRAGGSPHEFEGLHDRLLEVCEPIKYLVDQATASALRRDSKGATKVSGKAYWVLSSEAKIVVDLQSKWQLKSGGVGLRV